MLHCRPAKWLTVSCEEVLLRDLITSDEESQPPLVSAVNATMPADDTHRPSSKTEFIVGDATHLQLLMSCMDVDNMFAVSTEAQPEGDTEWEEARQPDQNGDTPCDNGDVPHSNGIVTESAKTDLEENEVDPEKQAWQTASKTKKKAFMRTSMLWVFQAHQRVKHRSKLSLLTFGAQQPVPERGSGCKENVSPSVAASVALSRTLHMENRASCGPAVDIWPPRAPVKAQVQPTSRIF